MICTFFGHSNAASGIREKTKSTIEELLTQGVSQFYVGNNGNFDYIVQSILSELIESGKNIDFTVVISRINEKLIFSDQKHSMYPDGLEKVPPRFAIVKRNDWMILHSDVAIVYVSHSFTNSFNLMQKATKRGLKIINIAKI